MGQLCTGSSSACSLCRASWGLDLGQGGPLAPRELSKCVSCLSACFRVSSVGWLLALRKSPWLETPGVSRGCCVIWSKWPKSAPMVAGSGARPLQAHFLLPGAGPHCLNQLAPSPFVGGLGLLNKHRRHMDRLEGTAPVRMSPSCSALSSEGSGPRAGSRSI